MIAAAQTIGTPVVGEVFADRSYQDDGTLTPRSQPGAMIETEARAVQQALGMIERGIVTSLAGKTVTVAPGTLCLHGDQPGAVAFATALRAAFVERAITLKAP